jgi:hypothetical protein
MPSRVYQNVQAAWFADDAFESLINICIVGHIASNGRAFTTISNNVRCDFIQRRRIAANSNNPVRG